MDFLSSVNKINQVLSYDTVIGLCKQSSIDDSMMITGVKMSGFTKSAMNPNYTVSSGIGLKSQQKMLDSKGLSSGYTGKKKDLSN